MWYKRQKVEATGCTSSWRQTSYRKIAEVRGTRNRGRRKEKTDANLPIRFLQKSPASNDTAVSTRQKLGQLYVQG